MTQSSSAHTFKGTRVSRVCVCECVCVLPVVPDTSLAGNPAEDDGLDGVY